MLCGCLWIRVLNLNLSSCKPRKLIIPELGQFLSGRRRIIVLSVYPHIQVWNLHIRKQIINRLSMCFTSRIHKIYSHGLPTTASSTFHVPHLDSLMCSYDIYSLVKTPTYPEINAVLQFDGSCGSRTSLMAPLI